MQVQQVQTIVVTYFDEFVAVLTYLAVVASALSGALEARHRNLDVVGAMTAAFATAFGGGTLRDLLLGRTPIFWVLDPWLTVAAFVTALGSYYTVRHVSARVLLVPDALGLGLFTMLGATSALHMKLSPLIAALMGVVTGVFGGVLRDTVFNSVPKVFRRDTELYATCSFIAVWVFIGIMWLRPDIPLASVIGTLLVVLLRVVAVRFKVRLPAPQSQPRGDHRPYDTDRLDRQRR